MKPWMIVLIVIIVVVAVVAVLLYFLGKKAQKKQAEQQEIMEANKQTVSMLIIDKKRMKLRDAGLPQAVLDQTPKALRGSKLPIGLYVLDVKGLHGRIEAPPAKKKGRFRRALEAAQEKAGAKPIK